MTSQRNTLEVGRVFLGALDFGQARLIDIPASKSKSFDSERCIYFLTTFILDGRRSAVPCTKLIAFVVLYPSEAFLALSHGTDTR